MKPKADTRTSIVVLDRGFVYVGEIRQDGDTLVITNARNIRRWGTTRGLGELALEGPKANTLLDPVGTVRAPSRSVMHTIDTEEALWATK